MPPAQSTFAPSRDQHPGEAGALPSQSPTQTHNPNQSAQSHNALAVSTWGRGHPPSRLRNGHGRGFTTLAYDANSVAVPNPRSWGRSSDNSQPVHEQPQDHSLRHSGQPHAQPLGEHYDASAPTGARAAAPDGNVPVPQRQTPVYGNYAGEQGCWPADQASIPQSHGPVYEVPGEQTAPLSHRDTAPVSREPSRHVSPAYQSQGLPSSREQSQVPVDRGRQPPSVIRGSVSHVVQPQFQVSSPQAPSVGLPPTAPGPHHRSADQHANVYDDDSPGFGQQSIRVVDEHARLPNSTESRRVPHPQQHPVTEFDPPHHSTPRYSLPVDSNVGLRGRPASPASVPTDRPDHNNGWNPKPSVELTDEKATWNSPTIQAWANNVNDTQQVPAAIEVSTEVIDNVSLPDRPDSARPVPKPVTVYISPDSSPEPGMASSARAASSRTVPFEVVGQTSEPPSAVSGPVSKAHDDDDFDRPPTPSDTTEAANESKEDGEQELGPDFWKEAAHPRDSPAFQSRRIIVV